MAFLRFSRDKRGYEHFQLVESVTRRGKTRTRVLYWFRTPPGIRVGREPFDATTRRELESHNPSVAFDWRRIRDTPIPSADAELWRERRREEKAARRAKKSREQSVAASSSAEPEAALGPPTPDADPLDDPLEPPFDVQ